MCDILRRAFSTEYKDIYKDHIAEEISDCYVLIEQIRNYYNISISDLKEIMTKTVKFCHADDSIESTARRMRKLDISCLPVVDDDFKLKGIISTDQISHLVSEYR